MTFPEPTLRRKLHGMMFKLPGMITCNAFEEFIIAYLDESLSGKQRFIFETHLKVCKECREYLSSYQKTLTSVQSLAAQDKDVIENVPSDMADAVIASLGLENN